MFYLGFGFTIPPYCFPVPSKKVSLIKITFKNHQIFVIKIVLRKKNKQADGLAHN